MALITNYATLKSEMIAQLDRTDLATQVERFIQGCESVLRRDPRVKRLRVSTLTVDAATVAAPANFKALDSISYPAGSSRQGDLRVVTPGDLSHILNQEPTGAPEAVAYHEDLFRFGPVPDQTYSLTLSWWENVPKLGGAVLSNWLLDEHPDIYFYGSLLESAPWLREDGRISVWESIFRTRCEELHYANEQRLYSGPISLPRIEIP